MPEKMGHNPQSRLGARRGFAIFVAVALLLPMGVCPSRAAAGDGASEALQLRLHAERAIAEERTAGRGALADTMRDMLHGMLLEYLASRDETIALDVVDAAFVREQVKLAELMEDPGLAWALDVFAGPETGYELNLRMSLTNLASFHEERAQRATEAAVRTYEREVTRNLDRLDKAHDLEQKQESHRIEATLVKAADRVERAEEKVKAAAEKAAQKLELVAEKAEERAEKAAEKTQEKAEQTAEKAEEKAEEKTEKATEKAEQQAEKEADKAADKGERDKGGKKKGD